MRASEDMARIDCEAGIIATLIRHPDYSYYSENLLPNHFTNKENRCIYQAICSLAKDGISTIDPYNIIQVLSSSEATRRYAEDINEEQLYTFIENSDSICRNSVEEYKMLVKGVLDAAFRRDTYEQLKECQRICIQGDNDNIGPKIYKMLDDVMMEFSTKNEVPPYKDVVDKCWKEIRGRQGVGYIESKSLFRKMCLCRQSPTQMRWQIWLSHLISTRELSTHIFMKTQSRHFIRRFKTLLNTTHTQQEIQSR